MLVAVAALLSPRVSEAAASPAAGGFVPVAPATVISNVSVAAGGRTTVTVAGANGVPAAQNLSAVALSVFAINPAATGFLQVFPAGSSGSGYTTLNFQQGRNAGSFEVVPVSADGRITVSSSASTKVLVRLRGYFTSATSTVTGSNYLPLPPATVLNNVAVAAGATTSFTVAGANGIPASANLKAVALDVFAINPAATGSLQVFPAGSSRSGYTTLNFKQGQNVGSFEVVPVSADGRISVSSSVATRVLVRLRGYYAASPFLASGGTFVPVAPATVISNVSVAAGGRTTVTVAGANGVPAAQNLSAVALSVFAINPAATGFLQVFPAGSSGSGYTTLNFQQGRNAGSFEVVPVSADGRITVSSSASTKVLVRLRGYVTNTVTPRGADWSHYRHGPAHPGVNSLETILDPSTVRGVGQAWVTSISGDASQPTVVGNVVHVGSGDGKLYALNALTGAVMWTLPTRGSIASSPAVVGGVVYAGSGDGRVFALNAGTGAVIWAAAVGVDVGSSPVVVDGVVYVGGFGKVLALNAATGAVIWTAQTGDRVMDSPAVADGVVYVRALDGKAYALDAATGFTEWVTTIGGKPTFAVPASISAPVVANGMVYVAGPWDGKLYGLNAATGAVVWTATAGFTVGGAPAVTGGTVYAVLGTGVGSNVLRALNAATGATIWQVGGGLTNVASTSPVVANGLLYTGTVSGRLDARNPNTGAVLWSDSTAIRSTRPYVSLVVANGAVYARRSSEVSAHHP